jgi:predicted amidohydrolase YtcJ
MTATAPAHGPALLVLADRVHSLAADAAGRALLVRGGVVAAIGDPDALRRLDPDADVLDLRGTTITPGLTDAHIHLTEWALARQEVDLTHAASPAAAAHAVAAHAVSARELAADAVGGQGRTSDDHGWIRGRGWNPHLWRAGTPHRSVLDAVLPDRPVALQSHDMHALWANSAALRLAGVDADTQAPAGGTIVRDEDGPTGLLLEAAGQLVARVLPPIELDTVVAAVRAAQAELHTLGITGVHSFPGIHVQTPTPIDVLRRLRESGELRLRVLHHLAADALDEAVRLGWRSGAGDDWLRVGGVKMFLDGALGSRTAWMQTPYDDGSGCGMRTLDEEVFRDTVRRAARAGIASTVHAIGDAAVCLALDVLADPATRVPALPHRIEHLQCCPAERWADAARAGVTVSMQPSHLMTDWGVADRYWGVERSRCAYALGGLLRHGALLAFGSDAPVEPVDPRRGLFAAVFRTDVTGQPEGGWFAEHRIDAHAALAGYTIGPARAAGYVAPAGTLAPGAPADFAAWDHDPIGQPQSILGMRCVATAVAGDIVYSC